MHERSNRQVVLRSRPVGLVAEADVELETVEVPQLEDGEALIKTDPVGVDAAVRTWLDDQPGYLPPVQVGEVVRAATVGTIVETKCDAYRIGDMVTSLGGFSDYSIARDDLFTTLVARPTDKPQETASSQAGLSQTDLPDPAAMLAVFGSTGATAYFGMTDIGQPAPGETVVVSAAAGATGSLAGQLAKAAGARVVGIAGTDQKCRVVTDEFGFDACINYRAGDLDAALRQHCPKRVDVYFDNVGGPILNSVLGRLAMGGRVVLCGAISSYVTGDHPGPSNYVKLMAMRGRMEGFNTMDKWDRYDEATAALRQLLDSGQLRYRSHVFDGLEHAADALNALFEGTNIGKTFLKP